MRGSDKIFYEFLDALFKALYCRNLQVCKLSIKYGALFVGSIVTTMIFAVSELYSSV